MLKFSQNTTTRYRPARTGWATASRCTTSTRRPSCPTSRSTTGPSCRSSSRARCLWRWSTTRSWCPGVTTAVAAARWTASTATWSSIWSCLTIESRFWGRLDWFNQGELCIQGVRFFAGNGTAAKAWSGPPTTSRVCRRGKPRNCWTSGWPASTWRSHPPVKFWTSARRTIGASRCWRSPRWTRSPPRGTQSTHPFMSVVWTSVARGGRRVAFCFRLPPRAQLGRRRVINPT